MSIIGNIYSKAKEKNILSGIIITELIAFIAYIIIPTGFFFFGDLQMFFGVLLGVYFALRNKKESQTELKTGLIVGLAGAGIAAISFSFYDWIFFIITFRLPFAVLLLYFGYFLMEDILIALVIGLLVGGIVGMVFGLKKDKAEIVRKIDDKFYESLKEKKKNKKVL